MKKVIQGEEGMMEEASAFVQALRPQDGKATLVTLSGELGAGKTTFTKGIASALSVQEHITSPTFVIMKIYALEGQRFERFIHMDAYRLKGARHLKILGWEQLINDPRNLIVIEWPEMIAEAIPEDAIRIGLEYSDDTARHLVYG